MQRARCALGCPRPSPRADTRLACSPLPRPGARRAQAGSARGSGCGAAPTPRGPRWGTAAAPAYLPLLTSWCRRRAPRAPKFLRSRRLQPEGRVETWKGLENWYLASTRRRRRRRQAGGGAGEVGASRCRPGSGLPRKAPSPLADVLRPGLSSARAPQRNVVGGCVRAWRSRAAAPGAPQGGGGRGSEVCARAPVPAPGRPPRRGDCAGEFGVSESRSDAGPRSASCLFKAGKYLPRLPAGPAAPAPPPCRDITPPPARAGAGPGGPAAERPPLPAPGRRSPVPRGARGADRGACGEAGAHPARGPARTPGSTRVS